MACGSSLVRVDQAKPMAVLWLCDECGGPANWTFLEGAAYYLCKRRCSGFDQLDLWKEPFRSGGGRPLEGGAADEDNSSLDWDGEGLPF